MRRSQETLVISICVLLLIFPNPIHPEMSGKDKEAARSEGSSTLSIIPLFGYTPETRLLGGIAGIHTFRTLEKNRTSSIQLSAMYTQNKQYSISLVPEFRFRNGEYRLQSTGMGFLKFPDRFYGIGNNTSDAAEESFTSKTVYFRLNLQKKIFGGLNIGVQYDFEKGIMTEVEEDGLLARDSILGSGGWKISGTGILVNRDNRDSVFFATKGGFYQILSMIYRDSLGSEYDFNQHNVDLRQYIPISPPHTLAFQAILNLTTGAPPFQKLSLLVLLCHLRT